MSGSEASRLQETAVVRHGCRPERIYLPHGLFGPAAVDRSEGGRVFASFWRWERVVAMLLGMAGTAFLVLQYPPGTSLSFLERPGLFYATMLVILGLRMVAQWLWRRLNAGRYEVLPPADLSPIQRLDASFAPVHSGLLAISALVFAGLLAFMAIDWLAGEFTMHPLIGGPMMILFGALIVTFVLAAWYRASRLSGRGVQSVPDGERVATDASHTEGRAVP